MTMTRMLAFTTLLLISAGPALAQDDARRHRHQYARSLQVRHGRPAMMGNPDQMQA